MKKLKFNLFALIGISLLFSSCVDDLDVTPEDDDVFLSEEFFQQPDAYKQGLAGVYGNLSLTGVDGATSSFLEGVDAGTSQYGRCLWYMQNLTTDEVIWSYENDPGTRELQRNTWNAQNPLILGMFSRAMVQVSLVNEYLRQTTESKLSGRGVSDPGMLAEIAQYREEVRVLRALAYYHLMDLYGKAPFVTEANPINTAGVEYDSQELFTFIESELNAVMSSLAPARTNEYGRVDQAVAKMILAKIYLNAEVYTGANRYTECAAICQEIISSGYTLNPDYLNNFKADNHTSPEMIFTLQSDGNVTQNYGPTTVMINGQVGSLEQNGISLGVAAGAWGGALRLREQFVQKFEGEDFVADERNTVWSGNAGRSLDITDIADREQGYLLRKFSNISSTGVTGPNSTFVNTDFPLFRLADVYLMYAECAIRGFGDMGTATNLVNALRERANNGTSANIVGADLTLDFILDERSRELHWEAHRRQDLIRFNKFTGGNYVWAWKGNGINGIAIPTTMKLFPIPAASLAANPNLSQNPGY